MRNVYLILILLGCSLRAFATGEPSTYFNIYVPPNNDAVQRDVALVVTAIYDSTHFQIIDDGMDGDTDDSVTGVLMAGQSYVLYIRDNGINDDARYASGGTLTWDGDYFTITSDKLVYASQSTNSDWQHDWLPSVNKSSVGEKFILYAPKASSSTRDLNVFPYEDGVTVTITELSTQAKTNTGYTDVSWDNPLIVGQATLDRGEDLIYANSIGRDLLDAGGTYLVEASGPVSVMYGALWGNSRDGGGYVPAENGSSAGELFYFAVPYQSGGEQEIRLVSWDQNNTVTLERYSKGNWVNMMTETVDSMKATEWVGHDHGASHATVFRARCSTGKRISVFEANWMETGYPGTSDMASMVTAETGKTSGKRFLVYVCPPGRQTNVVDPFTGTAFGDNFAHLYLFARTGANVEILDAYTGGTKLNRSYAIDSGRYADCALSMADWRSIYNGTGNKDDGPERPYVIVKSDRPISVMSTNFNDNWMMYFGSSLQQSFGQQSSASSSSALPGETVNIVSAITFDTDNPVTDLEVDVIVGTGAEVTTSDFVDRTDNARVSGTITENENNTTVHFDGLPDLDPTHEYEVETDILIKPMENDGEPFPNEGVIQTEVVVTGQVDGATQQSATTQGVSNRSHNQSLLLFQQRYEGSLVGDRTDAWTANWVDVNGDGYDDLFLTAYGDDEGNRLYRNNGDTTFTRIAYGDLVENADGCIAATFADIDNDGDRDAAVAVNGGFLYLYTNNGSGVFTDVSAGSGLDDTYGYDHGAAWADYDRDGYVDLFIANFIPTSFNRLYHNNGDGTFSAVEDAAPALEAARSIGPSWADYNNDGAPDLFVPNGYGASNSLYTNNGDGTFTRMEDGPIPADGGNSVGSIWGDIDRDGDLDLFVSNASNQPNFLYRNNGDGTFSRITEGPVGTDLGHSHGAAFVDADNDGDLDLYVVNDQDKEKFLYWNDGSGNFSRDAMEVITAAQGNTYGTAWSDFDRDGDLDLFVSTRSGEADLLFTNNGNGNHFLNIRLAGTQSNASGIGARVRVKAGGIWQSVELNAQQGFGGQDGLRAHFGLGTLDQVDSIEVRWPSGYISRRTNVDANQFITIAEDAGNLISGRVFEDANGNCAFAEGENTIAGQWISVEPGGLSFATDRDGRFHAYLAPGTYTFRLQGDARYWGEGCTGAVAVSISGAGAPIMDLDFAAEALQNGPDLTVQLASTAHRRGFAAVLDLEYRNLGTQAAEACSVQLTMPNGVNIQSTQPAFTSQDGLVYTWNLGTLEAGHAAAIRIVDSVTTALAIGDTATLAATVQTGSSQLDYNNDAVALREAIVGAIDPNDLLCWPEGRGEAGYIRASDTLTYRIRFENVGSFTASRVEIENKLPAGLDPASLVMTAASHPVQFHREGQTLHWTFDGIALPPNVRNPVGAQGFVEYRIMPKADLPGGTAIDNQAHIVFDFEAPMATNTERRTIQFQRGDADAFGHLLIQPNPMHEATWLIPDANQDQFESPEGLDWVRVLDAQGRTMAQWKAGGQSRFRMARGTLQPGTYTVEAGAVSGKAYTGKLVVE